MAGLEEASCLIIGAAERPPNHPRGLSAESQHRIIDGVRSDIGTMVSLAADFSNTCRTAGGAVQYRHQIHVRNVLLNKSIYDETMENIKGDLRASGAAKDIFSSAVAVSYQDKATVQDHVRRYLQYSPDPNLILMFSGHGEQHQQPAAQQIEERLLIPRYGGHAEHYTDKELTADIRDCLPAHKKLYIVVHSSYSGGMVNWWELDVKDKQVALFASAEQDIATEWNMPGAVGFLQSFRSAVKSCKNKRIELWRIAQTVQNEVASVARKIRPTFKTISPEQAKHYFLWSGKAA